MDDATIDSAAELPLRDIHLPEAISWWPLAPGWWWLLLLLMVVSGLLVWWRRRKAAAQVRLAALAEWQQLMTSFQQEQNNSQWVQGLSVLLRRVCLSYYPRAEVAGLSGEAWLHYLDQVCPLPQHNPFSEGAGRLLIDAPYRQQVEGDVQALHALCGEWLTALPRRPVESRQPVKPGLSTRPQR